MFHLQRNPASVSPYNNHIFHIPQTNNTGSQKLTRKWTEHPGTSVRLNVVEIELTRDVLVDRSAIQLLAGASVLAGIFRLVHVTEDQQVGAIGTVYEGGGKRHGY